MLRARTERLIIDTHRSLSQILDGAILALDNEIRPMRDGVDRDHLAVVRTQFDCIRKLLAPRTTEPL